MVKDLIFMDTNPALLVDGSNLLVRLLYARQKGSNLLTETELISSVADMFIHQLGIQVKNFNCSSLYIIFDIGGSHRKQALFADYKGNRELKPVAGALIDTKDFLFSVYGKLRDSVVELCRAFNLPVFMETGIEADDIIGIMAEQLNSLGKHSVILSNDTDFLQMVASSSISCYVPYKKTLVTNKNFPEYFDEMKSVKIHPAEYLFYKATRETIYPESLAWATRPSTKQRKPISAPTRPTWIYMTKILLVLSILYHLLVAMINSSTSSKRTMILSYATTS
jgi:5'-3' exonuclease